MWNFKEHLSDFTHHLKPYTEKFGFYWLIFLCDWRYFCKMTSSALMRRSHGKEFIVNTRTCAHVPISFCKRDVNPYPSVLTRWGRLMHICVTNLGHHWFRWWLVAWSAPSHCLNQCCVIVNLTLGSKLGSKQSNCIQNLNIFIQDNAFENILWKMAAICFGCNV